MKKVLNKKGLHFLFGMCTWACIVFILLVSILVILPVLPFKNTPRPLVVASGSMEPTIKTGSLVITMPQAVNTIKEGTIISFIAPNDSQEVILHRVTKISNNAGNIFLTTKGDNNTSEDAWSVPGENVMGKSIITLPYLGRTVNFMKTPVGFGLIIGLPALAFIFLKVSELIQGINEVIEKRAKMKMKQKDAQRNVFTLPLIVLWLALVGVSLLLMQNAWALFFDSVSVEGVSFETYTQAKTVVMNEFLWKSDCSNADKRWWIELWNGEDVPVDINHWRIKDDNDTVYNILDSDITIPSRGFLLLAKGNGTFTPACEGFITAPIRNLNGNPDFSVDATGGVIYLERPNSEGGFEVVDTIQYGPEYYLDTVIGGSIERFPLGRDSAIGEAFKPDDFILRIPEEKTPGE